MAKCKNCGKTLILRGGKCFYCEQIPNEVPMSSKSNQNPYTNYVGQNFIHGATNDVYGNPQGSQYDLAKDGAFNGYRIVIMNLLTIGGPKDKAIMANSMPALTKKGFMVTVYGVDDINNVDKIHRELSNDRCQLWIISDSISHLSEIHFDLIYNHFEKGRGLYIWSDNAPFFADSNILLNRLFKTNMSGNYLADQVLAVQSQPNAPGIIKGHPITTGIQNFYEGITISNVRLTQNLKPLVFSSDGKVVTAFCDWGGKRVLIDGGFTRLYCKWNSAGTDRFVVNCASWLANIERFGYIEQI